MRKPTWRTFMGKSMKKKKCKGPEAGRFLACLGNSEEVRKQ
jgi:hypothetical protein